MVINTLNIIFIFCYYIFMSLIKMLKNKIKNTLFTTPSHDGKIFMIHKFYQWYKCDISETDTYNPQEKLRKAEQKATEIYGTKSTHFLTNGSTSGVIAAVLSCCNYGDKLLIWNKAHICHKNAGLLSGAEIIEYELKYNEEWGIYEPIEPTYLEKILSLYKPKAVIITSPTYEGLISDIKSISKICKKNNVILIVDEAHGALYPFCDKLPESAVKYADFSVQSLHKTAGGINPTALLHCNCSISPINALSMINTTSPSYPMLATIEANINYLNSKKGRQAILNLISNIKQIKSQLNNVEFYGDDPTKILMRKDGITGFELSEILFDKLNIEDERTNKKSTMLLTGIGTTKQKLKRLLKIKKI